MLNNYFKNFNFTSTKPKSLVQMNMAVDDEMARAEQVVPTNEELQPAEPAAEPLAVPPDEELDLPDDLSIADSGRDMSLGDGDLGDQVMAITTKETIASRVRAWDKGVCRQWGGGGRR